MRANQERLNTVNILASELSEKSIVSSDDVAKRVEDLNGRYVVHLRFYVQFLFWEKAESKTRDLPKDFGNRISQCNQNATILNNQDIKKLLWQIYSKLPKVPFKSFSS